MPIRRPRSGQVNDLCGALLHRAKDYNPAGRLQSEREAREFDKEIKDMLDEFGIKYDSLDADETVVDRIIEIIGAK